MAMVGVVFLRLMHTYVDDLIRTAADNQASDIFFAEGSIARLKINGLIHPCGDRLLTRDEVVDFWKVCKANPEEDMDKDASYVSKSGIRFRVNCHKLGGKLGVVMRLIRSQIPSMGALGLPEALLEKWLVKKNGLVLVTGPTGSGKSTTLAACLEWINERMARHVVTIEDPMEFEFRAKQCFFTQREVGLDTGSFSSGLRSALRQAPDIIFVGEIRDAETALTALQAAETGHLVLGTLHSSSVTDALERFLHLMDTTQREGVQSLLSFQLLGVLSQQLLPNATENGSVLVCEHLDVEAAVRDWIRGMLLPEIREFMLRGDSEWNGTFLKNIFTAYSDGRISYETALAHCGNHNEFNRLLRGIS